MFAYRGEKVEKLENGQYAYTIENYSKDVLYRFELFEGKEKRQIQDYSESNKFICDIDVTTSADYELYCYMIPKEHTDIEKSICVTFMKKNNFIYDE